MRRKIKLNSKKLSDKWIFSRLTGSESLSTLYKYNLKLLNSSAEIDQRDLLGEPLSVYIEDEDQPARFISGIIASVSRQVHATNRSDYYIYDLTLRPALWYLSCGRDCSIWQDISVPEIVQKLLSRYNILLESKLLETYRKWEYCVQYQESDFSFISRLMEHEGIYYFFRHESDQHVMVLADHPQAHEATGVNKLALKSLDSKTSEIAGIYDWREEDIISPALYSTDDYDFRKPRANLLQARKNLGSQSPETVSVFDWAGHYTDSNHGENYTRVRQQAFAANQYMITGQARACAGAIVPGQWISVEQDGRAVAKTYLVASIECDYQQSGDAGADFISAEIGTIFSVVPASTLWHPSCETPWPRTYGPQTAVVTGPANETIWADRYGRVKVHFRWDRYGKGDDSSSCWIRVSSQWAGWKYGAVQVPRVGEEVIVDFINGDPDRPMIIGRVYNEDNQPPLDLPRDATRMGIMTRSKGGSADKSSYLLIDDALGRESVALHSERDMKISAEKDQDIHIQGNMQHRTDGNKHQEIKGNVNIDIKGNLTEDINGNVSRSITGSWDEKVLGGITISSPLTITINSGVKLNMQAPASSIKIAGHTESITGSSSSIVGSSQTLTVSGKTMTTQQLAYTALNIANTTTNVAVIDVNVAYTKMGYKRKGQEYEYTQNKTEMGIHRLIQTTLFSIN
ncbi:type VI secretion system Vgr family protein [Yersinia intermedia]|uniref:type VI secretion system Vgr family protein n=1 Tax=Yersinia intermedia TaxID=631 RepID=UPI001F52CCB0|nr:type VI secretion system tip protein TssI/VgrG [Yersinia intermedia]UNK24771.1 type VI secretion system tip protein VgrG [Yersinia intermedia]